MELEASEEQREALQAEVDEIRAQIAELEREKRELLKHTRRLEDRQVKNWKWMHEASKFSGIPDICFSYPLVLMCFFLTEQVSRSTSIANSHARLIFIRCG